MKNMCAVGLVCAGVFFVACAGVTWSQGAGYSCYDLHQVCSTYGTTCYPITPRFCNDSNYNITHEQASSIIVGVCVSYAGSYCYSYSYTCTIYFYTSSNCASGQCGRFGDPILWLPAARALIGQATHAPATATGRDLDVCFRSDLESTSPQGHHSPRANSSRWVSAAVGGFGSHPWRTSGCSRS